MTREGAGRDRDQILRNFRTTGPIDIENTKITDYPDYTAEVQRKHATFNTAKQILRDKNYSYSLMYPAKLRVVDGERSHIFPISEDAWTWIHAKGLIDPTAETRTQKEWLTPQPRRKKKSTCKTESGPTKSQVEAEQLQILKLANRFSSIQPRSNQDTNIQTPTQRTVNKA
ncbi:hypothetical protein NDU88_000120 [Pleurodeles waltl]|uniref:Uncharacterized protein n=1 Tax=Pleurodeles waltl TaxID=8319 RepID=A0AAV7UQ62_PLEWA|nr:hypothetical protein NDU88_000120 [Pleurodeles waltl]